uniref:Uncharacterized protein n=1 Tax=Aegilops tauschii TaxID=37682 RepID=M8C662_AEGTA
MAVWAAWWLGCGVRWRFISSRWRVHGGGPACSCSVRGGVVALSAYVSRLGDISKRTLLSTFAAPGNIVFQILPLGLCSLQEDVVHASVDDIERRLQEITVSDMSEKDDVAEYQHDLRAKEHNARWRLALLANNKVLMGNIFDPRATSVDACGNHGFAGTHGGFFYIWELSSGRKLTSTQCFNLCKIYYDFNDEFVKFHSLNLASF